MGKFLNKQIIMKDYSMKSESKMKHSKPKGFGKPGDFTNQKISTFEKPTNITINTGIGNTLSVDYLQNTSTEGTGKYFPLNIYNGGFIPTGFNGSFGHSLFTNLVYPAYSAYIQANVNFNVTLSLNEFDESMSIISEALQLYYQGDAIINFVDDPNTQNYAMYKLRQYYNPSILNLHRILKDRLEATAVPPNLVVFIKWLYETYTTDDAAGSNLLRLGFGGSFAPNYEENPDLPNNDFFNQPLSELQYQRALGALEAHSRTYAIIASAFPMWIIKTLPQASSKPKYDNNWITLNANHCTITAVKDQSGALARQVIPQVEATSDITSYQIVGDKLDGAVYACSSVFQDLPNFGYITQPGLFQPLGDYTKINKGTSSGSRCSWTGKSFDTDDTISQMVSGMYSHAYLPTGGEQFINVSGSQIPVTSSVDNAKAVVSEFLRWVFNLDVLKVRK